MAATVALGLILFLCVLSVFALAWLKYNPQAELGKKEQSPRLRTPYEEFLLDVELGILPEDAKFEGGTQSECAAREPHVVLLLGDGKTMAEYAACECSAHGGRVKAPVITVKNQDKLFPSAVIPGWEQHVISFMLSSGETRYGYTCPKCSGWWTATSPLFAADNSIDHPCVYNTPERRHNRPTGDPGPL